MRARYPTRVRKCHNASRKVRKRKVQVRIDRTTASAKTGIAVETENNRRLKQFSKPRTGEIRRTPTLVPIMDEKF